MDQSPLKILMRREARLLTVAVLIIAICTTSLEGYDVRQLGLLFLAAWTLCLYALVNARHGGIYRPSAAYLVLFGFFHEGMLFSIAMRGSDAFTAYDSSWTAGDYTGRAVQLAILGMAVFTLVAELSGGVPRTPSEPLSDRKTPREALAITGLVVQVIGVAIFCAVVAKAGGINVLSGGYVKYVEVGESDRALMYGTLLAGIGPVLAVAAGGRARVAAWTMFAGYAALALLVGTRSSVLFPLLALLVVEARLGRRPRRLLTVAGSLGVLTVIGLVRQTRQAGLSALSSLSSPMDAIAEMGYSLRPTVVVLGWHDMPEPFRNGATLVAVPVRFVERLTGWHGGAPVHDDRLFNVEIMDRVGPIGGSPIAEGYHNFGVLGVIALMAVIGLVLGALERAPLTPIGCALVGVVLLPLLVQVRNSFAPLPVQIGLGMSLLGIVQLWTNTVEKRYVECESRHGH